MWKWDQGRISYFQYDSLRAVATFSLGHDFKASTRNKLLEHTKLSFAAPPTHSPWRNYSRIYKLCLLISESNGVAKPTDIARIISQLGMVTCDEYMHFLVEATTDPSPALSEWKAKDDASIRSPLCFSLKYLLAKAAGLNEYITPINEIIGAYVSSKFKGSESDTDFLGIMHNKESYSRVTNSINHRQARESIRFISQISYLHNVGNEIVVSLNKEDAHEIFHAINPITGPRQENGNAEIERLAAFFRDGSEHDFFDYKNTMQSDEKESGFKEGSKVKKTHIVIERNSRLRKRYFRENPVSICDSCRIDTGKKYPWADRVLDLHHILPLSSGTRMDNRKGTILDDLVPICPTCHRAIHRYYDHYLKEEQQKDFNDKEEAREIYRQARESIMRDNCYA